LEADERTFSRVAAATGRIGRAVREVLRPHGANIITSAGEAASQSVLHLHLHVVPRWFGDAMGEIWPARKATSGDLQGMYIGLESAATAVKNFELAVIPGLLQTEEYARAIISAQRVSDHAEEIERRVRVRIARQDCLTEDPSLQLWTILDEGALRRQMGGREVMKAQLEHLVARAKLSNVTIQVLPFTEGNHPGTLGSIAILEFPEEVHSPVAYIETYAGDVYLEKEDDLRRVTLTYTHVHAAALSATRSTELIAAIARELA
jgi:diadenosine tetraphosphate (Ap4A) HIT family hydrolase